jgi:O-antigen ligase
VGSFSTGVVASKVFKFGELEGQYVNPGRLYQRSVHNTFAQLLAEQGLVGFGLWLLMLAGFLLQLRRLRAPGVVAAWNRGVGGQFDLYRMTVGLELAMVGYLAGAFFYNQLYSYWFYTLVLLAFLLARTAPPASPATAGPTSASS